MPPSSAAVKSAASAKVLIRSGAAASPGVSPPSPSGVAPREYLRLQLGGKRSIRQRISWKYAPIAWIVGTRTLLDQSTLADPEPVAMSSGAAPDEAGPPRPHLGVVDDAVDAEAAEEVLSVRGGRAHHRRAPRPHQLHRRQLGREKVVFGLVMDETCDGAGLGVQKKKSVKNA